MKKEVLIYDVAWDKIQEQDNPAFDYKTEKSEGRYNEAVLVMPVLPYKEKAVGKSGWVVIEVPIHGDVIKRGLFWHKEFAMIFAYKIAESKPVTEGEIKRLLLKYGFDDYEGYMSENGSGVLAKVIKKLLNR